MADSAIAVCKTCGMPVRVFFNNDGKIVRVVAVCQHVNETLLTMLEQERGAK